MSSEGGLNAAKKRLLTLIRLSYPTFLGATESATHVFGDWRLGIEKVYNPKTGLKMPIVTVRVSPARVVPSFYGRVWESGISGDIGIYSFTAHVFQSACTASGEEKYAHAHNVAEKIMHYLNVQDYHQSPHDDYPIADIFDLSARESEPKQGARNVCRIIIEGMMLVKRVD